MNNITPFQQLISALGSWPVNSDPISGTWNATEWDFEKALTTAFSLGFSPLFTIEAAQDARNNSVSMLWIDQGALTYSVKEFYFGELEVESRTKFIARFTAIATTLGGIWLEISYVVKKYGYNSLILKINIHLESI